jgi:MFS family permease
MTMATAGRSITYSGITVLVSMAILTLMLQVQDRGVGTIGVAVLLICLAVPAIATMGLAGRLADTHDSRVLLSVGVGVQVLAFAVLAASPSFVVTLVGAVLLELGQATIGPVWTALLPRVVGEDSIGAVIAWQRGLGAVATPIGAALGGVLYGVCGATPALLIAAGAFAVLWVAVQAIRTRRHLAAEAPAGGRATVVSGHVLAGVSVLRTDAVIWPTILALLPMIVMVEGVNAVEVFLARDTLGATPAQYGLGELAAGVGGVLGAALAGRLRGVRARARGTIGGFAVACGALAVAGGAPSFWFFLTVLVGVSVAAGVGNAANGALVVTRTPDAQRGAVGAALNGLARACGVVALAMGGLLGTLASPRTMFVVGGVAGMLAVLALGWRSLRAASREVAREGAGAQAAGGRWSRVRVAERRSGADPAAIGLPIGGDVGTMEASPRELRACEGTRVGTDRDRH